MSGDHYRNALRAACESRDPIIHFGFLDRLLYALADFQTEYLKDISQPPPSPVVIFERTSAAWATHPQNYALAEEMIMSSYEKLLGRQIDLCLCAMTLNQNTGKILLENSVSQSFNASGEWILKALQNGIDVRSQKVDWLSWEDPFWEKADPQQLKLQRENDPSETLKRYISAQEFLSLVKEDKFKSLFLRLVHKT